MTAMPTGAPIADPRTGTTTPPWIKWFQSLDSAVGTSTAGTVDSTAQQLALLTIGDDGPVLALLAMLSKRVDDLEKQVMGVR